MLHSGAWCLTAATWLGQGHPANQESEPAGLRERTGQPGWQMPLKEHGGDTPQLGICARVRLTWCIRAAADCLNTTDIQKGIARTGAQIPVARVRDSLPDMLLGAQQPLFNHQTPAPALCWSSTLLGLWPRWLSSSCKATSRCASGAKAASAIDVYTDVDRESCCGCTCGLTLPCLLLPGGQGLHDSAGDAALWNGGAAGGLLWSLLSDASVPAPCCQVGENRTVALQVPALWDGAAFQALLHQETVPPPLLSRARAALGNAAGVSVSAAGLWEFMALQFGVFLLAVCHLVRPLAASPCRLAGSMWECPGGSVLSGEALSSSSMWPGSMWLHGPCPFLLAN